MGRCDATRPCSRGFRRASYRHRCLYRAGLTCWKGKNVSESQMQVRTCGTRKILDRRGRCRTRYHLRQIVRKRSPSFHLDAAPNPPSRWNRKVAHPHHSLDPNQTFVMVCLRPAVFHARDEKIHYDTSTVRCLPQCRP